MFLKEVFSVLFCSTSTCLICTVWQRRTTVPSVHLQTTWLSTTLTPQQSKPQKTVCAALNIINGELVDLGLPINVEKSAALLICPSAKKSNHLPSTPPILLCGTPVNVVTEMRLLGVIVDNQLSCHPKSTLSYRKLAKRSAFSEETYISFRLPLAVFSTWQSFNRTLSMQLQQRYLSYPLLCVIASVLWGGGQCAVSPRRIGKQKLPPFWKIIV